MYLAVVFHSWLLWQLLMSKLAEILVIEYLNREGYTTAQSVKKGHGEWDILALQRMPKKTIAKHFEVQVSFDPVSYLSNSNAKKRSPEAVESDMDKWIKKKYEHNYIREIRKKFYPGSWKYGLIHGKLKDQRELDILLSRDNFVTIDFFDIIESLCSAHPKNLPFTAEGKDLVEIIRYVRNRSAG